MSSNKRRAVLFALSLLLPASVWGQQYQVTENVAYSIVFTHDCQNVTGFHLAIDGVVVDTLAAATVCGSGTGTFTRSMGSAAGTYVVVVSAYQTTPAQEVPAASIVVIAVTTPVSCTYTLSPTSASYAAAATTGHTVAVGVSGSSCVWGSATQSNWLSVTAGGTGTGAGTLTYAVAANVNPARTGSITIAGTTFPVSQAAPTGGDTTPPVVSVTKPLTGSTVSRTAQIAATATDAIGVTRVVFAVNGVTIRTDTSSPYTASYNFRRSIAGTYTIAATAYDAAGNTATSTISVTK